MTNMSSDQTHRPIIVAHRGASFYRHQNTVESFRAALEMQAEMVELDVRRTADGRLVVHHDPDIGGRAIAGMSWTEARQAAADNSYALADLEEVVALVAGRCALDVELKEAGYEEEVTALVLGQMAEEQVVFTSSIDSVVLRMKEVEPTVRTGLIIGSRPRRHYLAKLFPRRRAEAAGVDLLVVSRKLLPAGFLRLNRHLGLPVWVYTANDRKDLWKLITDGRVDGIFTDRVDVGLFLRDLYAVESGSFRS